MKVRLGAAAVLATMLALALAAGGVAKPASPSKAGGSTKITVWLMQDAKNGWPEAVAAVPAAAIAVGIGALSLADARSELAELAPVVGFLAAVLMLAQLCGDEGLFASYSDVQFRAPVRAGDVLEVAAEVVAVGRRSRTLDLTVTVVARGRPEVSASAAEMLAEPVVATTATGVVVVPVSPH